MDCLAPASPARASPRHGAVSVQYPAVPGAPVGTLPLGQVSPLALRSKPLPAWCLGAGRAPVGTLCAGEGSPGLVGVAKRSFVGCALPSGAWERGGRDREFSCESPGSGVVHAHRGRRARRPRRHLTTGSTAMTVTTGLTVSSEKSPMEKLAVNTIRTLSMDAVQAANSGHPGTPMALA